MNELKLAAAYIRVSTEDQTEYSPDAQLVEIRKFAARGGYLIPDEHIYVDEGISGRKTQKRDAFNLMIGRAKLKPRPFDAILLWKFSRFARNREDSVVYKSMLRRQLGIEVLSVSEPMGDDKMSVLIEALIEAMDEYYSINLAEEVKRGMTEKARRGELQTSPPFGYGAKDQRLVPVPDEAELIRQIFARFIAGEGLYPLARWLNELGVRTHRGNKFENRTVEYIIRNPVYIGKLRWNPAGRSRRDFDNENIILADSDHEPLIDEEIWNAAQARISAVKAQWKYKGRPSTELKDWTSGLIRCATCGTTLIFQTPGYYRCSNYARGRCLTSQFVKSDLLKTALLDRLERDLSGAYPLNVKTIRSVDSSGGELDRQRLALDGNNKKWLRLNEAYLSGVYSLDEFKSYKDELASDAERIRARILELENVSGEDAAAELLREALADTLSVLRSPSTTLVQKHDAAAAVIESCIWSKADSLLTVVYRLYL